MSLITRLAIFVAHIILLSNINAVPTPSVNTAPTTSPTAPTASVSVPAAFKTGAKVIYYYTLSLNAPNATVPLAHQDLVNNTCELLSSYDLLSESVTRYPFTEQMNDLLQFLRATLNHGCVHVRGVLGGEVTMTVDIESGSGGSMSQEIDSCSNLHYLHSVCHNFTQQVQWQSLLQTSQNLRRAIDVSEGLGTCGWLRNNVVVTPNIQALWNGCF